MSTRTKPEYKTLHEIFTEVSGAKTKAERVEILKRHNFLYVRDVIRASFDNQITLDLPDGIPPFTANEVSKATSTNGRLAKLTRQIAYFVKGSKTFVKNPLKREKMWVMILETLHPDDVPIFSAMKDKTLDSLFKGINKKLAKEVWPQLIRD